MARYLFNKATRRVCTYNPYKANNPDMVDIYGHYEGTTFIPDRAEVMTPETILPSVGLPVEDKQPALPISEETEEKSPVIEEDITPPAKKVTVSKAGSKKKDGK